MAYSQASKEATMRYREKNRQIIKEKQKEYSRKHYLEYRQLRIDNMKTKREFLRMAGLFCAFE